MRQLPSIFQLSIEARKDAAVAAAVCVIGPRNPMEIQSWDLSLCGAGFVPLTRDPFSFVGLFTDQGVSALVGNLLRPAGFELWSSVWFTNTDRSECHAILQKPRTPPRPGGSGDEPAGDGGMTTADELDAAYYRISKSWRSLSRQDKQIAIVRLTQLEAKADALGTDGRSVGAAIRALRGMIELAVAER